MNPRTLLVRGMLVGAAAGVLAFVFGRVLGEPWINDAIAYEGAHEAHGGVAEPELVSRAVQSTVGLGVATVLFSVAMGGIFALAFAFVYGRVGRAGVRATAGVLAICGFVAVCLVPFVKYPANPPAVGNGDTIGQRTGLYFLMLLIGVAAATAAATVRGSLVERLGPWNSTLVAVAGFLAVVAVAYAILPGINEVPADFPATLLWRFRLASLGTQVVVWTTFGVLFGALTERAGRVRAVAAEPATVS